MFAVLLAAGLAALSAAFLSGSGESPLETTTNYWVTNADRQSASFVTAKVRPQTPENPVVPRVVSTNYSWPLIRPAWPASSTNLSYAIWTNCMIRGMNTRSQHRFAANHGNYGRPPTNHPAWTYDTNGLLYGWRGMTAIAVWNQSTGGQVPITMVTRRHGYRAGHQTIPANGVGVETSTNGTFSFYGTGSGSSNNIIWFMDLHNVHHAMRVYDAVSGAQQAASCHSLWQPISLGVAYRNNIITNVCPYYGDVGIFMFTEDLPPEIETMKVARFNAALRGNLYRASEPACQRL